MDTTVIRDVKAPTEAEARTMAAPILDAFLRAGWELREQLWIPGDRRPGLGESLLLNPEDELLLEGEGTLHLMFANADPAAVAPATGPAVRVPDTFESIGGVRYRRLVPRWGLGIIVAIIGLIVVLSVASGMQNGPFAARPTPEGGVCPFGWIPGMRMGPGNVLVPDGTCQRMP
jgi:hypothetical protein